MELKSLHFFLSPGRIATPFRFKSSQIGSASSPAVMSVSVSSIPAVKDKPFHSNPLKGSPVRGSGYYAAPLPGAHHYMDIFRSSQHPLHPLKSLGRLVTDTQAVMPFNFTAGNPSFFGHGGHAVNVLHEQIFNVSNIPYFNRMIPGVGQTIYSKHGELAAATEHVTGPLSDFSSPASSERSSVHSVSPSKASLFHLRGTELSSKKTRTYSFSEDDLFTVLYGYTGRQEQNTGHAISGIALTGNSGRQIKPLPYRCHTITFEMLSKLGHLS